MYDENAKETYIGSMPTTGLLGHRPTLRERLIERQKEAQERLNDITQALEFLDKNPGFETFHNLIGKTGF